MSIIKLNGQSLAEAVSSAKPFDTLVLENKVYREKVVISVPDVTLMGSPEGGTAIVYGDYANKIADDGLEYNTFRTYTVHVTADGVKLKDLAVVNDAMHPAVKGQAVALSVSGDRFYGENLKLVSLQDTLFCGPLPDDLVTRYMGFLPDGERYFEGESRQLYKNCTVLGSVDFVFGTAAAFFDGCTFVCCNDGRREGYVAAPAHSLKQRIGFVFYNCKFEVEKDANAEFYLARPWRNFGKASFIGCKLSPKINQKLFDKWGSTNRDKTARFEVDDLTPYQNIVSWAKKLKGDKIDFYLSALENLKKSI